MDETDRNTSCPGLYVTTGTSAIEITVECINTIRSTTPIVAIRARTGEDLEGQT